ncbi:MULTISPECIES: DUF2235 domain-containing protein [unclassified Massilia]|uniref:DUF2235 domain-containing protein n=1 Tax=unclassified Massilia TaxID=2609279 RepID=UPI00068B6776|nr:MULTISPECIES: DUF2235 domain-containing protein [unclassified Massilia]AWG45867.1 hypothetical protein AM586_19010 [Massilia sp. WG5]
MKLSSFLFRQLVYCLPLLLSACAMVSGGVPLPVTAGDRELIKAAQAFANGPVPLIRHELDGRPNRIFKVAFDGTMNDRSRVPPSEQETVVASIARRIDARYFPGPGMQNPHFINLVDAAFGYSSASIAEGAEEVFFEQANAWLDAAPDTEVRVFVTGFSRGAAIARHFINLVVRDWPHRTRGRAVAPHFYAMLFDTVSTGQTDALDLSLPMSLDYLVHFVAKDEPRFLFVPVFDREVAADPDRVTRVFNLWGLPQPQRINLVQLPGAHSDIGSAYDRGVAVLYRSLSEQLLYEMGLLEQNCWETSEDVYTDGKHDSRGLLDRMIGAPAANSAGSKPRQYLPVLSRAPGFQEAAELNDRLSRMAIANYQRGAGTARIRNERHYPAFEVRRQSDELQILRFEPADLIDKASIEFKIRDGQRRLTYRFIPPYDTGGSSLLLSDPIWNRLPDGRAARISYSAVRRSDGIYLASYVDDVLAISERINEADSSDVADTRRRCQTDERGNKRSPLRSFVIPAAGD